MSVIRVARRARFTTVSRETLNDGRLSFRARGILAWLLDKPDDWRIDSEQIAEGGVEGRDAVRKALRELEACGYLVRERERVEKGRFTTIVTVFERPHLSIDAGQTDDGIPVGGATSGNDANEQVGPETDPPTTGSPTVGGSGALTKTVTEDCETPLPPSAVVEEEEHMPTEAGWAALRSIKSQLHGGPATADIPSEYTSEKVG